MTVIKAAAPDAAAYAPVTLLVDERADGVHLSYASDLDSKILNLLETAALQRSPQ